jgi:hypothetical protein
VLRRRWRSVKVVQADEPWRMIDDALPMEELKLSGEKL